MRQILATNAKPKVGGRIQRFFLEVWAELTKVVWPNRQETIKFTIVVMAAVGVISIYIYIMDAILGTLTRSLYTR